MGSVLSNLGTEKRYRAMRGGPAAPQHSAKILCREGIQRQTILSMSILGCHSCEALSSKVLGIAQDIVAAGGTAGGEYIIPCC